MITDSYFWAALSDTIFGAGMIILCLSMSRVVARLKIEHHETYLALGKPAVFVVRWNPNRGRFWRYMRSKEYMLLNDDKLNDMMRKLRLIQVIFAICSIPFIYFNIFASP